MNAGLYSSIALIALCGAVSIQGCGRGEVGSQFSIEQIAPQVVRADKPPEITITGAGLDKADWVGFGFSDDPIDRKEIVAETRIKIAGPGTIRVIPPALPGITESTKVWVTAGRGFEESPPALLTYRPPYVVETHFPWFAGTAALCAVMLASMAMARLHRKRVSALRRLSLARQRRARLASERRERRVDEYLKAERQTYDSEYLPHNADQ
ncbi:MAG: hypothetical protein AMXMBFR84_22260 [Candidatus Hydrogenedentota bacterium]